MKTAYRCSFCGKTAKRAWRCTECGYIMCANCSKGGKSTGLGKFVRTGAAIATYGISEVARAGYRKVNQKCIHCGSIEIMSL